MNKKYRFRLRYNPGTSAPYHVVDTKTNTVIAALDGPPRERDGDCEHVRADELRRATIIGSDTVTRKKGTTHSYGIPLLSAPSLPPCKECEERRRVEKLAAERRREKFLQQIKASWNKFTKAVKSLGKEPRLHVPIYIGPQCTVSDRTPHLATVCPGRVAQILAGISEPPRLSHGPWHDPPDWVVKAVKLSGVKHCPCAPP